MEVTDGASVAIRSKSHSRKN